MKILVGNTKGGVGKSTTSVQILAPFLFELGTGDPVPLVEFDDENKDAETFTNSTLIDASQTSLVGTDLIGTLSELVLSHEHLIVDIGGNKTTSILLNALEGSGMMEGFDVFVIPLMDGEQDAVNAIRVYNKVRSISSSIAILFALSKVDKNMSLEMQFFDWVGDVKDRINGVPGLIEEVDLEDRNIIFIHSSDVIKYSRIFGNTVYEIAAKSTEEMKIQLSQAIKSKEGNVVRKLSYKMDILHKSIQYKKETLEPCFKVLEGIKR
jgi:nitrogenase subunit NifH